MWIKLWAETRYGKFCLRKSCHGQWDSSILANQSMVRCNKLNHCWNPIISPFSGALRRKQLKGDFVPHHETRKWFRKCCAMAHCLLDHHLPKHYYYHWSDAHYKPRLTSILILFALTQNNKQRWSLNFALTVELRARVLWSLFVYLGTKAGNVL